MVRILGVGETGQGLVKAGESILEMFQECLGMLPRMLRRRQKISPSENWLFMGEYRMSAAGPLHTGCKSSGSLKPDTSNWVDLGGLHTAT